MKKMTKYLLIGTLAGSLFTGCKEIQIEQLDIPSLVESGTKVFKSISRASEEINPEQEYYIGRTVSVNIYDRYSPYNNKNAALYLNKVGKLLSLNSDMPETFGGYHFAILDSNEVNAFAAPGGFIYVTKGMIRLCDSEDALAAVLAHEISHVQLKHGIDSIKKSRITSAVAVFSQEGAKQFGNEDVQKISEDFGGAISDIMNTLVVNGYSRSFEYEADKNALVILKRTGYDQNAMVDMLARMKQRLKSDTAGFGSTHPRAQDRIDNIVSLIDTKRKTIPFARKIRFDNFIKNI